MNHFLNENYQFRVNTLRERTEWRRDSQEAWRELDDRSLNTIYFELLDAGIAAGYKDVERYLYSEFVPAYHPFRDYFDGLPAWDGRDRVTALARRVSRDELWISVFHDATGSRRFFCVDVKKINCTTPINHAQIFAQLKAELDAGEPTWFTKREELRIERSNARFYRLSPLQTALLTHYRVLEDAPPNSLPPTHSPLPPPNPPSLLTTRYRS